MPLGEGELKKIDDDISFWHEFTFSNDPMGKPAGFLLLYCRSFFDASTCPKIKARLKEAHIKTTELYTTYDTSTVELAFSLHPRDYNDVSRTCERPQAQTNGSRARGRHQY
jgi:hypothetical protein